MSVLVWFNKKIIYYLPNKHFLRLTLRQKNCLCHKNYNVVDVAENAPTFKIKIFVSNSRCFPFSSQNMLPNNG